MSNIDDAIREVEAYCSNWRNTGYFKVLATTNGPVVVNLGAYDEFDYNGQWADPRKFEREEDAIIVAERLKGNMAMYKVSLRGETDPRTYE